jgi:hypothetical protein
VFNGVSKRTLFEILMAYVHQTLANGSWVYKCCESIHPAVAFQYQLLALRIAYGDFHICHPEESRGRVAKSHIGEEGFNVGGPLRDEGSFNRG